MERRFDGLVAGKQAVNVRFRVDRCKVRPGNPGLARGQSAGAPRRARGNAAVPAPRVWTARFQRIVDAWTDIEVSSAKGHLREGVLFSVQTSAPKGYVPNGRQPARSRSLSTCGCPREHVSTHARQRRIGSGVIGRRSRSALRSDSRQRIASNRSAGCKHKANARRSGWRNRPPLSTGSSS